jgi:hypothetical protein
MKRLLFILLIFISACTLQETEVTSYETCVAAGNPVMETYPPQCEHDGINYVYAISDFDSCIAEGHPAMESYPRQCNDGENTYTEDISWKEDGIELMQHSLEGYYGCFGCIPETDGSSLCIDPVIEMRSVFESDELHCNSDFEVIGSNINSIEECLPEQRGADACIEIYQPVCGSVDVECFAAPCNPVNETFSNSCFACSNPLVSGYTVGEC